MGTKSPAEYAEFLRRALRAYSDNVADSDSIELPMLVSLHTEMESLIKKTIRRHLMRGVSWATIADSLGIPTSTAQSRWGHEGFRKGRVVYGLKLDGEAEVRYVGKSKNLGLRIAQHRANNSLSGTALGTWLRTIHLDTLQAVVLEEYDTDEAMAKGERYWYDKLLSDGHPLVNGVRPRDLPTPAKGMGKSVGARQKESDRALEEKQRLWREAQETARIARSNAWWEREIAAGRATIIDPGPGTTSLR